MPYWAGVMSPYWDGAARGAIVGLSLDHAPAHLFRAVLEGIAFEQAIATRGDGRAGSAAGRTPMIAAGGGTNSQLLMQIMATVLERPLVGLAGQRSGSARRGHARRRRRSAGTPSPAAASRGDGGGAGQACRSGRRRWSPVYRARKAIYRDLYHATRDIHAALSAPLGGQR